MTEQHPDRLPPGNVTPNELYNSLKHLPFDERWEKFNEFAGHMCGMTPCEPYKKTKAREKKIQVLADVVFGEFEEFEEVE